MHDSAAHRLDMFIRVREEMAQHADIFPPSSRGAELLVELNHAIEELQGHAAAQSSGKRASKEETTLKAVAHAALREDMEAMTRTARAMAITMPGLDDKFRLPRNSGDQAWLAAARSFAHDAEPLKAEFIKRGMPEDFLEELNAKIEEFEACINRKARKTGARVAATAAINNGVERGTRAVRELDAIMRNTFRNDPTTLARWLSASHVERGTRSHAQQQKPAQTQTGAQPTH